MKINPEELLGQLKKQKDVAIGLDIGKDAVKLVELAQEGETIRLSKIDSAKIPPGSTSDITQAQLVKRIVANLLAKNQIKQKEIILGLKGELVFMKFLEVLPVNKGSLEQTIKYEAQQQIPFSLDEVEWDAQVLGMEQAEETSAYRVLLVAIKKDKLASSLNLIGEMGLHPPVLDVSSISLYNTVRFNQDYDENKLTCVLELGAQSSDLLVLQGANFWMRTFAVGGDNITEALMKKFDLNFADAQKLKQEASLDSPDIREAVQPVLEDLQAEILRSVEYYYFQQKQAPLQEAEDAQQHLDAILLSGGASLIPGLDRFLAENFSCPIRFIEPFKMLHIDEEMKAKLNAQNKVLFAQAVGLALRGLDKSYIRINLFKGQIKAKKVSHQRLVYGVGSVILALVIILGASTFMRQDYRDKALRLHRLKNMLNTFSTYQAQAEELAKKKQLLQRQVAALSNLVGNRYIWLDVLAQLEKMLPDDLWITDFTGTLSVDTALEKDLQNQLDLQGRAVSYEGVNSFISRLKSSTMFSDVKPLSSAFIEEQPKDKEGGEQEKEKTEVVKFSISTKVLPVYTPGVSPIATPGVAIKKEVGENK